MNKRKERMIWNTKANDIKKMKSKEIQISHLSNSRYRFNAVFEVKYIKPYIQL